jgi:hypothetical protein
MNGQGVASCFSILRSKQICHPERLRPFCRCPIQAFCWLEWAAKLPASPLSSRPKRTRISYFTTHTATTYAALRKESGMKSTEATALNRKSGVAEWRDLQFPSGRNKFPLVH